MITRVDDAADDCIMATVQPPNYIKYNVTLERMGNGLYTI